MKALWKWHRTTMLHWGARSRFDILEDDKHRLTIEHTVTADKTECSAEEDTKIVPVVSFGAAVKDRGSVEQYSGGDRDVTYIYIRRPRMGDTILVEARLPRLCNKKSISGEIFMWNGWRWKVLGGKWVTSHIDIVFRSWNMRGLEVSLQPDRDLGSRLRLYQRVDRFSSQALVKEGGEKEELDQVTVPLVDRRTFLDFMGGKLDTDGLRKEASRFLENRFQVFRDQFLKLRGDGIKFADAVFATRAHVKSTVIAEARREFEQNGLGMIRVEAGSKEDCKLFPGTERNIAVLRARAEADKLAPLAHAR